ncbi:MAG: SDR family NAD(P)-dependent oxidoreductase [Alphaproteobacteria bacterium]|nr:SDR family NAD(P)-dependent oxidoreductase [Alphaproteobacteria bacterium]
MYKPVLVTGASSGIGEAAAVALARKGFRVYAGARRLDRLKALEGLGQGGLSGIEIDVADEGSIDRACYRIEAEAGPIYGVVNNAGISVMGPIEEVSTNEWRRQFETNVFGIVAVCQRVLPRMREAKLGRIVNIGSVSGRIAAPFQGAYASSKHAVEGLTDALRREVEPFGIKVSLIRPGFVNTPFGEQEQEGLDEFLGDGHPYAPWVARFKAWHAKGHPKGASPMDVAETVVAAMTADRPHSRYVVPAAYLPALMMRNLLPSAIVDRLFARINGVAGVRRPS